MNWELIYCLPVILLYNFVLRQLYIHCMICFLKIYNYVHIPISECVSIYGKIRCVSFLLHCPNIVGMFFCSASNFVDHQKKKNKEFIAGALFAQRSETGILLSSILFRWWHFILSWYYYFRQIFSIIASSQSHTSLTISIIIHIFYSVFGSLLFDSLTQHSIQSTELQYLIHGNSLSICIRKLSSIRSSPSNFALFKTSLRA